MAKIPPQESPMESMKIRRRREIEDRDQPERGREEAGETSWTVGSQVTLPYLLSGIGMVLAGFELDIIQHWPVFKAMSEIFILAPALVGLKGNLEMTLASRLSTAANTGKLDSAADCWLLVTSNLAVIQLQSTVVGLISAVVAITLGSISGGNIELNRAILLCASSASTAFIASLILSLVMVAVILGSRKVGVNPDNVATPIAASLGDLVTLSLLAAISSTLYQYADITYLAPAVCGLLITVTPVWLLIARRNSSSREVLQTGWQPVLVAMLISSCGGLILDKMITDPRFQGMAVFTPVINGVGGNLVAIQASRISTYLHQSSIPGELPQGMQELCPNVCQIFLRSGPNSNSARVLLFLVVPGHLLFLFTIHVARGGHASITRIFTVFYLIASLLQVFLLLCGAELLVRLAWKLRLDPDNFSIPYLTAFGDLLGISFLAICFYAKLVTEG
ncbi:solute carrier family 41 member 3 isoform X1 [Amblyraja radiata]|uniref:solute carrier family 41 member 3 isoform X1 n=2 Tax=Amblyraja radiata TaxID=386614 RepID=UPI0014029388|nr:solute carrier family 41 member 3 isoform X1 [Amblyraja radiata]